MARNRIECDESQCIACGCTDSMACPEGCEWVLRDPPLCSSCVPAWMLARALALLGTAETRLQSLSGAPARELQRDIHELRSLYNLMARRGYVPKLRRGPMNELARLLADRRGNVASQ